MFKITNLHGTTMILVEHIERKGDAITMKGNMMGTMPGTFYVTPEEMWNMFKMVNLSLIFDVMAVLIKGRKASQKGKKP
jgi:hypothetical protein